MGLRIVPTTIKAAKVFVRLHHRHHKPPVGALFAVGIERDGVLVGVAIAGRPVARMLQDGKTIEVLRTCTTGAFNACSMINAALWRAARALGYTRLVTYILKSESGSSLKALKQLGFRCVGESEGGTWSRPSRERTDEHPTGPKWRWEVTA